MPTSATAARAGEKSDYATAPRRSGVRKVTYCADVRRIIDDVSVSGLHHTLRKRR